jgi:hypothetical protein
MNLKNSSNFDVENPINVAQRKIEMLENQIKQDALKILELNRIVLEKDNSII